MEIAVGWNKPCAVPAEYNVSAEYNRAVVHAGTSQDLFEPTNLNREAALHKSARLSWPEGPEAKASGGT